jgi:hypothetical protein
MHLLDSLLDTNSTLLVNHLRNKYRSRYNPGYPENTIYLYGFI